MLLEEPIHKVGYKRRNRNELLRGVARDTLPKMLFLCKPSLSFHEENQLTDIRGFCERCFCPCERTLPTAVWGLAKVSYVVNNTLTTSVFISLVNWCNSCEEAGRSQGLAGCSSHCSILPSEGGTGLPTLFWMSSAGDRSVQGAKSMEKHISIGGSLNRGKTGAVFWL